MIELGFTWIEGALLLLGLVLMSVAVYGMVRMPDIYISLHAASKTAVVGLPPFLIVAALGGDPAVASRALLIILFLLLTTPVSAHEIARAAYRAREPLKTPGAIDETGHLPTPGQEEPG